MIENKKSFDFEVLVNGHPTLLIAKKYPKVANMKYDIYNERQVLLFSLDCCTDEVKDSYKLSKEFEDKNIDPDLIASVNEILKSEEE